MNLKIFLLLTITILLSNNVVGRSQFYESKRLYRAFDFNDNQVKALASKTDLNNFNRVLDEILIPRVVGTPQHKKVANFIKNELESLDWNVESDSFKDTTPIFGELEFENIIGRLNPNADRFLVLACHYDSKYSRENDFIGATDSAVPCAMMLNLAKVMQRELEESKKNSNVSLAFIFFDGEEAFQQWGPKDSIYGARHLAARMEKESYTASNNGVTNQIDRMDILVLLDLLGAPNPKFYSYFPETERWYVRLVNIEDRLDRLKQLKGHTSRYFVPSSIGAHIEDDHVPFLKRDVPVLHIIPSPFPAVWHQPSDNRDALDMDTIENLNKIFREFVAEYLHINI